MKKLTALTSVALLSLSMSGVFAADLMQDTKDTAITSEVKTLLFEKKAVEGETFSASDIHVTTKNGQVILQGHVKTETEKTRAGEIAKSADGVRSVKNELVVE